MEPARLVVACGSFVAVSVSAQAIAPDPAPALRYESSFTDYRRMDDAGPGDWKQLNDRLKASVEQRAQAMQGGSAPAKPAASPSPQAHGEHSGHGGKR